MTTAPEPPKYLEPWDAVSETRATSLEAELAREVSPSHLLDGRKTRAVAARFDCDDVLFEVEGLGYAVVHLTYSRERETSPNWPSATLFSSFDDWCERGMRPDHDDYV